MWIWFFRIKELCNSCSQISQNIISSLKQFILIALIYILQNGVKNAFRYMQIKENHSSNYWWYISKTKCKFHIRYHNTLISKSFGTLFIVSLNIYNILHYVLNLEINYTYMYFDTFSRNSNTVVNSRLIKQTLQKS